LPQAARHLDRVACPFCALGCDDVRLAVAADGGVTVDPAACAHAVAGFGGPVGDATPLIDGLPATLDQAIARAAAILGTARAPLIHGLACDLAGQRAALQLARRIGGTVDHLHGAAINANLRALADGGWLATSLAEIRNRSDLVVAIGDPTTAMPRFWQRCVFAPDTLTGIAPKDRQVVLIGPSFDTRAATSPDGMAPAVLSVPDDALPALVATLVTLARGGRIFADAVAGLPVATLRDLVTRLEAARYGVIAWSAGALAFPHADLTIASLGELLRAFNRKTRVAGLPVGGLDNALGAQLSALWLTGKPPRLRFVDGEARHDATLQAADRLLLRGEADALLWIDALGRRPPPIGAVPPVSTAPTVALVRPGTAFAVPPAVLIPVGTPGLDHAGHVLRGDAIVALPLDKLRDSGLPAVADTVSAIDRAIPPTLSLPRKEGGDKQAGLPSPRGRGLGGWGDAARSSAC